MNEWKSVYVMKTDNGTIKIGISKDVSKRAKALNCLYPFNIIDFYKTKPCSNAFEIEKIMHTKFSKEKYFGEWFYADYLKPDEEESFLQGKNKVEMEGLLEREQIEEIKDHIYRRGVNILGGKQSEAYHDASIRSSVYSDMYRQLKREYGAVSSYKSIKRKYIADVHEFIDCYEPPTVLAEQINGANAQMRFGG